MSDADPADPGGGTLIAKGGGWEGVSVAAPGPKRDGPDDRCEDACTLEILPDGTALAVLADGAGSAESGALGAAEAVQRTRHALERRDLRALCSDADEVRACAEEVIEGVRENMDRMGRALGGDIGDLSATLLAVWATDDGHGAFQIGDGFSVVREAGADGYDLLFEPARGEYANQTVFVTSAGALDRLQVCASETPLDFACVASDGLTKVALHTDDWTPGQAFFRYWEEYLGEAESLEEAGEGLHGFLAGNEELRRRSTDDRSMVLLRRRDRGRGSEG